MKSPFILIVSNDTLYSPCHKSEVSLFSFLNDQSVQSHFLHHDIYQNSVAFIFKADCCNQISTRFMDVVLGKAYRIPQTILDPLKRIFEHRQISIQRISIQKGRFSWVIESSDDIPSSFFIIPVLVAILIALGICKFYNREFQKITQTLFQTERNLKLSSSGTPSASTQKANSNLDHSLYFSLFQTLSEYPFIIKTISFSQKNFTFAGYLDTSSASALFDIIHSLQNNLHVHITSESEPINESILLCHLKGTFL